MKFGFCLVAFIMGCFTTVFMTASAPEEAAASHSISANSDAMPNSSASTDLLLPSAMEQFAAADPIQTPPPILAVTQFPYGKTKSGETVTRYECINQNGYRLEMIDYGATITAFHAPDRNGEFANVVLGCGDIEAYQVCSASLGSTIGDGCEKNVWHSEAIKTELEVGVRFVQSGTFSQSPIVAEYTLNDDNDLTLRVSGKTLESGSSRIFNKSFWNLSGAGTATALNHLIRIDAQQFYDPTNTQFGMLPRSVTRTAFDFRQAVSLGRVSRGGVADEPLAEPMSYRHCWLVNHATRFYQATPGLVAEAFEPKSGRKLEVLTNQSCLHLETGNELNGQPASGGFEAGQGFQLTPWSCPETSQPVSFTYASRISIKPFQYMTIYRFSVQP